MMKSMAELMKEIGKSVRRNTTIGSSSGGNRYNGDSRLLTPRKRVIADASLNGSAAGAQHSMPNINVHKTSGRIADAPNSYI
jgi:hypothetical protein